MSEFGIDVEHLDLLVGCRTSERRVLCSKSPGQSGFFSVNPCARCQKVIHIPLWTELWIQPSWGVDIIVDNTVDSTIPARQTVLSDERDELSAVHMRSALRAQVFGPKSASTTCLGRAPLRR